MFGQVAHSPVVVTLTGWLMLIKGVFLLFLSPEGTYRFFLAGLHYEHFFYQYIDTSACSKGR